MNVKEIWNKLVSKYLDESTMNNVLAHAALSSAIYSVTQADVVLGFYPLYKCQRVEYTTSQDVLKFRSVGAQYLAKQKGAYWAMRLDIVLDPPEAADTLNFINLMYVFGGKYEKHENVVKNSDEFYSNVQYQINPTGSAKSTDLIPTNDMKKNNDGSYIVWDDNVNFEFLKNTWHETFAVSTKDQVYTNCFIESFIYYIDMRHGGGKEVHATVLLRRFTPPPEVIDAKLVTQEYADRFSAQTVNNTADIDMVHMPGEEVESVFLVTRTNPDGTFDNRTKYVGRRRKYWDQNDRSKTTPEDDQKIEITKVTQKSIDRTVLPGTAYMSYGYAERVSYQKERLQLTLKPRMKFDLDMLLLGYNVVRRTVQLGELLMNEDFNYRLPGRGIIPPSLDTQRDFGNVQAFTLGTNDVIDVDPKLVSLNYTYKFDDRGEITADDFEVEFKKSAADVYSIVGKGNLTHYISKDTYYIYNNVVLFTIKNDGVLVWKYGVQKN